MSIAEFIGYAGSLIILVSLLMKSLLKLRWLNLAGSVLFSLYGLLIQAWPVFVINAVIVGIDAWFIYRTLSSRDFFDLSPLSEIGPDYFKRFFLYHEIDIQLFFPDVPFESLLGSETFMLFRNMLPVGFFSMKQEGEEARVVGDYVIPEYRDFKTGTFIYGIKRMYFKEKGIKRFVAHRGIELHNRYLLRNGFRPDPTRPDWLVKAL